MRTVAIFLLLSIMMFACRPARQVQKAPEPVTKVDTTAVILAPQEPTGNNTDESVTSTKGVFDKVIKNKIDFATFNAKVRVQYQAAEGGDDATAYIRLKKDSALWLSLRGPLGIEGFRILITADSVKVLNVQKKNVQFRGIDLLQEVSGMPLDFATLQDLVVGNPVFIDTNIVSSKETANGLEILMSGSFFKNLVTLDTTPQKVTQMKLESVDSNRSRTCNIVYSNYENTSGIMFSTQRKISITDQSAFNLNLDFKQYTFNQPITFPFNIPKNYKRL